MLSYLAAPSATKNHVLILPHADLSLHKQDATHISCFCRQLNSEGQRCNSYNRSVVRGLDPIINSVGRYPAGPTDPHNESTTDRTMPNPVHLATMDIYCAYCTTRVEATIELLTFLYILLRRHTLHSLDGYASWCDCTCWRLTVTAPSRGMNDTPVQHLP